MGDGNSYGINLQTFSPYDGSNGRVAGYAVGNANRPIFDLSQTSIKNGKVAYCVTNADFTQPNTTLDGVCGSSCDNLQNVIKTNNKPYSVYTNIINQGLGNQYVGDLPGNGCIKDKNGTCMQNQNHLFNVKEGLEINNTIPFKGNIYFMVCDDGNYLSQSTGSSPVSDNYGNYTAKVTTYTPPPTTAQPSWFTKHIALNVVSRIKITADTLSQTIYTSIVTNNSFIRIVNVMLTLYIVFYSILFTAGLVNITSTELIKFLFKFIIVLQLIKPDSFAFFQTHLFTLFTEGMNQLAFYVTADTDVPCLQPSDLNGIKDYITGKSLTPIQMQQIESSANLFCFVDEIMSKFFSK
jgi:hypothetical protein